MNATRRPGRSDLAGDLEPYELRDLEGSPIDRTTAARFAAELASPAPATANR